LPKKGRDIGSSLLVTITVIISASIAGINLLTMFGFIQSPDVLTYGVFIGLILVPTVIIGGAVNKVIIEQKKALKNLVGTPSKVGDKLKINLRKKETTMADTSLHPAFYFKIGLASVLSVLTGLFTLIVTREGVTGDIFTIYPMLIPLIGITSIIHMFSKNMFEPNGWREFLEHTWIAFFTIALSISFMISLKNYVRTMYPRTLWETFLGLPFSLQTLMYLIILLLIGGILIRMGDLIELESSPLKASGITLVLVSMIFLIPQFQFIPLEHLHELISIGFSILLIFYGLTMAVLFYQDASLRYIVTSERIIKLKTNKLEKSYNYPLSSFKDIGVVQGLLAKSFGYGNVNILFSRRIKGRKRLQFCVLHGVKKPHLLANTIKALAHKKKSKKKPRKKKIKRKRIKKTKPIKKKKKNDFYYKALLPWIVIILSIFLINSISMVPIAGGSGTEGTFMVEVHHEIDFENLTSISMNSLYDIHRLEIEGDTLDADEVRELYHLDGYDKSLIEDELLYLVESSIEETVNGTFGIGPENGRGEYDFSSFIVEESLNETAEGPILLNSEVDILLYPEWYDIPEEAKLETLVFGVLKVGGELNVDMSLYCEEGHIAIYDIYAPTDLEFLEDDERKSLISKELDNIEGTGPRTDYSLRIAHEDPLDMYVETQNLDLLIDIYELKRDTDREYISADVNLSGNIHGSPVPSMIKDEIPQVLDISKVNADLLRLLYDNGFDNEIDDFLSDMQDEINLRFSMIFEDHSDEELTVKGLEEGYDVENMDSDTPISIFYNNSFQKDLSDVHQQSALVIQRRYRVDEEISLELNSFKVWGLNYTIKTPQGVELIETRVDERQLDIQKDGFRRNYVEDTIDPGETVIVDLTVGTEIDIYSFLPFVVLIVFLFFTWIGINMYPAKKRKKLKLK